MKSLNRILFVIFFSLLFLNGVSAQKNDSIVKRNVTVEREYIPVIRDAGKILTMPTTITSQEPKIEAKYTSFNLPLNISSNIHTLSAANLNTNKFVVPKQGFARLGAGNYLNTVADFAYPLYNSSEILLDFSLNHRGTFGDKMYSTTNANLNFKMIFDALDFYAGLNGGNQFIKYYGDQFNNSGDTIDFKGLRAINYFPYKEQIMAGNKYRSSQLLELNDLIFTTQYGNIWRAGAYMGIMSSPDADEWKYKTELKYDLFNKVDGVTENVFNINGGLSKLYMDDRIGLDADFTYMTYKSIALDSIDFWKNYGVLQLSPYYRFDRSKFWNVRLGVNLAIPVTYEKEISVSPDIQAEWTPEAISDWFNLYGGITGEYTTNSMSKLFYENPYLYEDVRVRNTYTPFDLYAGVKIKPIYNLLLNAFVDFKYIDNQYFFVNKMYTAQAGYIPPVYKNLFTNRFDVIYSTATHLKVGMRADYNYQDWLSIQLQGAFNGWDVYTEAYAWNKPAWEGALTADVRVVKDLTLSLSTFYESKTYAKLGNDLSFEMKQKVDVNIGGAYTCTDWLSVFLNVNNILNNKYQSFYGYEVQGLNALVGVTVSF